MAMPRESNPREDTGGCTVAYVPEPSVVALPRARPIRTANRLPADAENACASSGLLLGCGLRWREAKAVRFLILAAFDAPRVAASNLPRASSREWGWSGPSVHGSRGNCTSEQSEVRMPSYVLSSFNAIKEARTYVRAPLSPLRGSA